MKSPHWLSACLAAGSLAGAPAQAQPSVPLPAQHAALPAETAAGTLSLRKALDAAWLRSIAARETDGQRRRAEADRAVAGSLWAGPPAFELSHRDDRLHSSAGSRETEAGIALPLWMPGQRSARSATAEAAMAQSHAAQQAARLRLAGELREAAGQLAGLRAEADQAEALAHSLLAVADDVARRVRAGDLAPADDLAARAEHLAASAQQLQARQRLEAARARWALLTGMDVLPPWPDASAEDQPNVPQGWSATHPEVELARQSTALARQRVSLMQQSRRDAPELTLSLRQSEPGRAAAAQGSVAVGLRLPLGTDDRNRPLEAAALSDLDLAQAQEERLRERLESEQLMAQDALRAAQAQLKAERSRAQLLRERAALIDRSFRAGETPLPELLRALSAAAQADSAAARQHAALGLAQARLQQALGILP